MNQIADVIDIGTNLPWRWHVGALLCWGIVVCLCLLFLNRKSGSKQAKPHRLTH